MPRQLRTFRAHSDRSLSRSSMAEAVDAADDEICRDLEANQQSVAVVGNSSSSSSSSHCCCSSCSCCCRCLSCFGYRLEDELRIVNLFTHFVPIAEMQTVAGGGIELLFASDPQLERAQLLAKFLVASNMPFKWQPGRLHGGKWACQGLTHAPKLWQRLLKAFYNYFSKY